MTGAERGTAYHRAMQLLELESLRGLSGRALADNIRRQLDDFANRRLLTDAQREVVRPTAIGAFIQGETGQRLLNAESVRREWPFNALVRASEALTPEEAGQFGREELLVQGTVDCCFKEDGQWVLLDYKTDRADDPDAVRDHYRKQLSVYALAIERITGIPVKQRLLCLISADMVLEV
jgi:ATP-dependent helicase/nuclease subunit A